MFHLPTDDAKKLTIPLRYEHKCLKRKEVTGRLLVIRKVCCLEHRCRCFRQFYNYSDTISYFDNISSFSTLLLCCLEYRCRCFR